MILPGLLVVTLQSWEEISQDVIATQGLNRRKQSSYHGIWGLLRRFTLRNDMFGTDVSPRKTEGLQGGLDFS